MTQEGKRGFLRLPPITDERWEIFVEIVEEAATLRKACLPIMTVLENVV